MHRTWSSLYWGGICPALLEKKIIILNNNSIRKKKSQSSKKTHLSLRPACKHCAYSHVSAVASLFFFAEFLFFSERLDSCCKQNESPCLKKFKVNWACDCNVDKGKEKKFLSIQHYVYYTLQKCRRGAWGGGGLDEYPPHILPKGSAVPLVKRGGPLRVPPWEDFLAVEKLLRFVFNRKERFLLFTHRILLPIFPKYLPHARRRTNTWAALLVRGPFCLHFTRAG